MIHTGSVYVKPGEISAHKCACFYRFEATLRQEFLYRFVFLTVKLLAPRLKAMSFRSLFIGIDRYKSPLISNLWCAVRDAQALYGLFGDAFGISDSLLLTNEQATRAAILQAIKNLQRAKPADVVVIGFSGHGCDTHHLITHNADPIALDVVAILVTL